MLKYPNEVLKRKAPPRMNRTKKKQKVIDIEGHVPVWLSSNVWVKGGEL
jgi:hypothetical protein